MVWSTPFHPTSSELEACVQCGLCLPACPTFRLTGNEAASPRGRLTAMSGVASGTLRIDAGFAEVIDSCLGCRACEPVCPGLVPYGRALEGARTEIAESLQSPGRRLKRLLVARVLMRRGAVSWLAGVGRPLARLMSGAPRRLLEGARRPSGDSPRPGGHWGAGTETIGLLTGCVQGALFGGVNRAAIQLLVAAGYRVEAPSDQQCCGALAAHDGQGGLAVRRAEANTAAFAGCDHVTATAAGCSAHLKAYSDWAGSGDQVAARARDITELVASAIEAGRLPRLAATGRRIAIQDPCHLRHAQGVQAQPRLILEAGGYEVVEIDPDGLCCGAAGTYSMFQSRMAAQLGELKKSEVEASGVTEVASANPGCEMQLRGFLGSSYRIAHPVEWYLEAVTAAGALSNV